MPKAHKYDIRNIGRGMNTGIPATLIDDSESYLLKNMTPYGPIIRRRGGTFKFADGVFDETITYFQSYRDSNGVWGAIVGGPTKLGKLNTDGTTFTAFGTSYTSSNIPWAGLQYNDVVYLFRKHAGMRRLQVNPFEDSSAGIPAPITAVLLTAGASGVIPPGTYSVVGTWYNATTGQESNPSPVSNEETPVGDTQFNYSLIPAVAPHTQVTHFRIYRTLKDSPGAWYHVVDVPVGQTSYVGENVAVDAMGRAVRFDNDLPPGNLLYGVQWNDRIFASDGRQVYFTPVLRVESFPAANAFPVGVDDGADIVGLLPAGDRLYIFKTNSVHYITGNSNGTFVLHTLDNQHGAIAHHTNKFINGRVIWMGVDAFYVSDGGPGQPIGDGYPTKEFLAGLDQARIAENSAALWPEESLYIVRPLMASGSTYNQRVFVMNYITGAWATWLVETQAGNIQPGFIAESYTVGGKHQLWAAFEQSLFTYNDHDWGYDDLDRGIDVISIHGAIAASWQSKAFGLDQDALLKAVRRVHVNVTPAANDLSVFVWNNDDHTNPIAALTIPLTGDDPWRTSRISTLHKPSASIMVGFSYAGVEEIEIRGVSVEAALFRRSRRAA